MPNQILTLGDITREVLMLLVGELSFARNVNREFDSRFGVTGAKIGATANIRKPPRYTVGYGAAITTQAQVEQTIPVVLDKQSNIAVEFTSADLTLSLDDFGARFLKPAARRLANEIDAVGLQEMYKATFNQVGSPGSAFSSLDLFYDAMVKLQSNLAGIDDLKVVLNTRAWTKASSLMMNLFAPKSGDEIIKSFVANAIGFSWYMDSNIVNHTVGAYGAGPLAINGAAQSGATLVVDGLGPLPANLKRGDVFTIAGVYAVHPNTKAVINELQQFVVAADATANVSGSVSLSISPAIVTSGAYQNVSAGPADNAVVTVAGASGSTYTLGLAFAPDAYVLATAKLQSSAASPENITSEVDTETGIALTTELWRDGRSGTDIFRVDALWGWSPLRPELSCRIVTA